MWQRLALGRFAINLTQELQPFDLRVSLLALPDDLPVEPVEPVEHREQRGRAVALAAVALAAVRHRLRAALLHRQAWLRAVQALDLTLLIATQHHGMLGRGQVQAHDVFQLLDELWVARDHEPAHDVRLQTVGLPVPHDPNTRTPERTARASLVNSAS